MKFNQNNKSVITVNILKTETETNFVQSTLN